MSRQLAILLAVAVLATGACGAGSPPAPTPSPGGFLSVYGAWARAARAGDISAAYLTITNGRLADDVLVGASTPAARAAEIHETTTTDGMTGMNRLDSLEIPAGRDVVLDEGGHHVMLIDLAEDLLAGATFPLTLTFEQTGPVTVAVEVRG